MAIGKNLQAIVLGAALGLGSAGCSGCGSTPTYSAKIGCANVSYSRGEDESVLVIRDKGVTWRYTDKKNDNTVDVAERLQGGTVTYAVSTPTNDASQLQILSSATDRYVKFVGIINKKFEDENAVK